MPFTLHCNDMIDLTWILTHISTDSMMELEQVSGFQTWVSCRSLCMDNVQQQWAKLPWPKGKEDWGLDQVTSDTLGVCALRELKLEVIISTQYRPRELSESYCNKSWLNHICWWPGGLVASMPRSYDVPVRPGLWWSPEDLSRDKYLWLR